MSPFRPALSGFPRTAWSSALTRVLRSVPDERFAYPDPAGTPELRVTLAAYLGRVRGVRAEPEQIVVTNGLRQGIDLLWSTLAASGARRVAVEDPGWRGIHETAGAAGLEVVALGVDEDGLIVEYLECEDVDAVAVAPAHQYPTGAVLSPSRRAALLAWAQERDALIVEDDYDAEYRYDRQPIGSLQGLAPERVVYGGDVRSACEGRSEANIGRQGRQGVQARRLTVSILSAAHSRRRSTRASPRDRVAGDEDLVWPASNGQFLHFSNLRRRVLLPAREKACVEWVGFHAFRHTCATLLFAEGRNAVQVQRWLGHHSPAFTLATYVHLLDGDVGAPLEGVQAA
jgi:hypothetical protein